MILRYKKESIGFPDQISVTSNRCYRIEHNKQNLTCILYGEAADEALSLAIESVELRE
jgi:hypothetical protein